MERGLESALVILLVAPIRSAGMGGVARSELVAAVSATGAFGHLGMVRERVKGVTPGLIDIDTLSASNGGWGRERPGHDDLCRELPLHGSRASADECGHYCEKHPHHSEGPFRRARQGSIHRIDLDTEASISKMAAAFEEHAQKAKKNCPISRALSGVDIHLRAKLL
jgi:hypothetical protein